MVVESLKPYCLTVLFLTFSHVSGTEVVIAPICPLRPLGTAPEGRLVTLFFLVGEDFSFFRPGLGARVGASWARFTRRLGATPENVLFYNDGYSESQVILKTVTEVQADSLYRRALRLDPYFIFVALCFISSYLKQVASGARPEEVIFECLRWTEDKVFLEKMLAIAGEEDLVFRFPGVCRGTGFLTMESADRLFYAEKFLVKRIASAYLMFSERILNYFGSCSIPGVDPLVARMNYLCRFFVTLSAIYKKTLRVEALVRNAERCFYQVTLGMLLDFYPDKNMDWREVFTWMGIPEVPTAPSQATSPTHVAEESHQPLVGVVGHDETSPVESFSEECEV